jgi:hypothetical protein
MLQPLVNRLVPVPFQFKTGLTSRPQYAYCLWHSAQLAKSLGLKKISAIEFGVAGGNGLVAIEGHAAQITRSLGVEFEIYGFDTGAGLPPPEDYRDLPYHWQEGFFKMEPDRLRARLEQAEVIFGNVKETVVNFLRERSPAPIGCIFHDLDFYSSTRDSFEVFNGESSSYLPRIFNYFDDIVGSEVELYNEFTGERLAIAEFNQAHPYKKFSKAQHFVRSWVPQTWHHQIYILHDFKHPQYNQFVSEEDQQRPLD